FFVTVLVSVPTALAACGSPPSDAPDASAHDGGPSHPSDDAGISPESDATPDHGTRPGSDADVGDAREADVDAWPGSDANAGVGAAWTGRPPAAPLFVRTPYLSTWSAADSPNGVWPTFWTGAVKGFSGIARIDGAAFLLIGAPHSVGTLSTMSL